MSLIALLVALGAAGYAVVTGGLYAFQRNLLYLPSETRPAPEQYGLGEMEVIRTTTADGLELYAWYAPATGGRPTIVYLHGNAGHVGYRAERVRPFLDAGVGVLLVGYRGFGCNPGRPTEAGLYRDAEAALRWLGDHGVAPGRTVLYGESLGTAVAVEAAARMAEAGSPAGALVLEAPMSSIVDVAAHHYPLFPVRALLKDRFEAEARIGDVAAPLLVIHGAQDRVVPIRFGRRLFDAATQQKKGVWIEGAGHEDLGAFGLHEVVLAFVDRTLGLRGRWAAEPAVKQTP
jgi:fermentation-respiration switch protein FrsA (DUF1100 family)